MPCNKLNINILLLLFIDISLKKFSGARLRSLLNNFFFINFGRYVLRENIPNYVFIFEKRFWYLTIRFMDYEYIKNISARARKKLYTV